MCLLNYSIERNKERERGCNEEEKKTPNKTNNKTTKNKAYGNTTAAQDEYSLGWEKRANCF